MRWVAINCPIIFLAKKRAAPMILSYSWKESWRPPADRDKSFRTDTTSRPIAIARRTGDTPLAALAALAAMVGMGIAFTAGATTCGPDRPVRIVATGLVAVAPLAAPLATARTSRAC